MDKFEKSVFFGTKIWKIWLCKWHQNKILTFLLNSSKNITIPKHKTATIINLGQNLDFWEIF